MRLSARGLVCDYGPTRALDGVDIDAAGGSILAVFGPNGAGKTTLLRALSGERRPDAGEVTLNGAAVSGSDPAWRARVALVSHRTGLYRKLTVGENLAFFGALHGLATDPHAGFRALEEVDARDLADIPVEKLSRGQRQRAALARSLLHDPDVLFLDEPFTGLDPGGASTLEAMLQARREADTVVVLVTHDLERGLKLADRALVLRRGRSVLDTESSGRKPEDLLPFFTAGGNAVE
ncbi:MAG: heme ABC exporter ATP-binding protein CcmA [Gemmatimonadota bacterium]|nr:heme ABC exporter ATP-binding protein CcmA [Gemmatimonadota bacterium]MDE2866188.1 heme ABC exporter ATP-binding protein CcmA [Gemmatimonadota bacterium]MXV95590.1 heme ABC exporter ATP-binding protein CcmA [Gemmatimonadota bacterium]MYE16804.1 heme ABC exporter ATP-binding protein CcmA [Gemmatimonadota bacterium]